jgi:hypothetical protein
VYFYQRMTQKNRYCSAVLLAICLIGFVVFGLLKLNSFYNPLYDFEKQENNHGLYRDFYPNGKLKSYEAYFKGQKNGPSILFDENGDTIEFANYQLGKRHGQFRYYSHSRQLVQVQVFDCDKLIQDTIFNYLLYRYDYKAFETGLMTFEKSCLWCHQAAESAKLVTDTLFTTPRLDSIHLCVLDTLDQPLATHSYLSFNQKELEAIKFYLLTLQKENNSLRNNGLTRTFRKRIAKNLKK